MTDVISLVYLYVCLYDWMTEESLTQLFLGDLLSTRLRWWAVSG